MNRSTGETTGGETPIRIRAHTLLCLQGFRGLGYSPEFVSEMQRVRDYLWRSPHAQVEVISGADVFCERCPHHHRGRCTADDPEDCPVPLDSPDNAVLKDRRVLSWLGLKEGTVQDWCLILSKVAKTVDSSVLDVLCGDCSWREYPYCAEALDDLHWKAMSGEALFQPE